jgi:hypothetical protein
MDNAATAPADTEAGKKGKGTPASFCVPRAAIEALLDAKATAYEICAYLTLAKFTDATGVYTPASVKAVNTSTGGNKKTIETAIERLLTIRAKKVEKVSNGRSGKSHNMVEQATDLGPILYTAAGWLEETGEILPDGPTERGAIRYVLPDFGEALAERVWFGAGLVDGFGAFTKPMKKVKDGGDVAARLLLAMYAETDMEGWGGVNPHTGPWSRYMPMGDGEMIYADTTLHGGGRMIFGKWGGGVAKIHDRITGGGKDGNDKYFRALELLESSGLFYEAVLVLNRNGEKKTFSSGGEYLDIPHDAEPLYELGARCEHGHAPDGEHGLGAITANTAGDLHRPVGANAYAAIVRRGQGAMIVGIYRPRFRVANPKNDGVIRTWSRIRENNAEAVEFIQAIRAANGMEPFPMPTAKKKASTEAPDMEPPATTDAQHARAAQIEAIRDKLVREKRVAPVFERFERPEDF